MRRDAVKVIRTNYRRCFVFKGLTPRWRNGWPDGRRLSRRRSRVRAPSLAPSASCGGGPRNPENPGFSRLSDSLFSRQRHLAGLRRVVRMRVRGMAAILQRGAGDLRGEVGSIGLFRCRLAAWAPVAKPCRIGPGYRPLSGGMLWGGRGFGSEKGAGIFGAAVRAYA